MRYYTDDRDRWKNDPSYRKRKRENHQAFLKRFYEQNGVHYTTHRHRQLKQEIAQLRAEKERAQ